ncbi:CRISPR-associated protein Cas5 [Vibrio parahaemolyticus]
MRSNKVLPPSTLRGILVTACA